MEAFVLFPDGEEHHFETKTIIDNDKEYEKEIKKEVFYYFENSDVCVDELLRIVERSGEMTFKVTPTKLAVNLAYLVKLKDKWVQPNDKKTFAYLCSSDHSIRKKYELICENNKCYNNLHYDALSAPTEVFKSLVKAGCESNIAIGHAAGTYQQGNSCIAIGHAAGTYQQGNSCIAIGYST